MANLGGVFDATKIKPDAGREPIPSGEYPAMIVDSDMRKTKDGSGQYLELVHEIMDGPYKGRKLWARLNLVNQNQQTASIAQAQLSAIAHATGVLTFTDSQQLHNRPMLVRVEFLKAAPPKRDTDSNEIRGWKSLGGAAPAPAPAPGNVPAAPAASANGAPPWARQAAAA